MSVLVFLPIDVTVAQFIFFCQCFLFAHTVNVIQSSKHCLLIFSFFPWFFSHLLLCIPFSLQFENYCQNVPTSSSLEHVNIPRQIWLGHVKLVSQVAIKSGWHPKLQCLPASLSTSSVTYMARLTPMPVQLLQNLEKF